MRGMHLVTSLLTPDQARRVRELCDENPRLNYTDTAAALLTGERCLRQHLAAHPATVDSGEPQSRGYVDQD